MFDFETRQSATILTEQLPPDGGDIPLLNAPSTIETLVRNFGAAVLADNARYLGGELSAEAFKDATQQRARDQQEILYGRRPAEYFATTWHDPSRLGAHIMRFGPLADSPNDAVFGLFGYFASRLINLVNGNPDEDDQSWQAEIDDMIESYTAILMGHADPPPTDDAG